MSKIHKPKDNFKPIEKEVDLAKDKARKLLRDTKKNHEEHFKAKGLVKKVVRIDNITYKEIWVKPENNE